MNDHTARFVEVAAPALVPRQLGLPASPTLSHLSFSVFAVFRFHRPGNICDGCDTSPVIGDIHACAYTSIREVLSQVLQGGLISVVITCPPVIPPARLPASPA